MRSLRLAGLASLAFLSLAMVEAALAPGGSFGSIAGPAFADDDDDGGGRGGGGFGWSPQVESGADDDDDFRPRRRYRPASRAPRREARQARRREARPEIVAAGVTAEALGRIRAAGFAVIAEGRLSLLPEATVRLGAPRNLSAARARARLAELAPGALIDVNGIYRPNAGEGCAPGQCFPYRVDHWSVAACAARGPVGMIDTKVDAGHGALAGRAIETLTTRGEGRQPSSEAHGTEVAILLAGRRGQPDDLKLVAVDAFHRTGGADQTDVFDLVAALDLLVERKVAVANLSLAGPPNAVLDRAGAVAAERGLILVAAVGNEGPKAKPRYPAAYHWAVAVTAVDAAGEPYRRAGRGPHVAFAAPGVRLELPDAALKPGKTRSGTSYAAPLVAAALSALRAEAGDRPTAEAITTLAAQVEDKGAPGRDPIFGWGALAHAKGCPSARAAATP